MRREGEGACSASSSWTATLSDVDWSKKWLRDAALFFFWMHQEITVLLVVPSSRDSEQ